MTTTSVDPAVRAETSVCATIADEECLQSAFADKPVIARILSKFVGGLDARLHAMTAAHAQGQLEEVRRLAHQLKGGAGSYGYPSLAEAAKRLEFDARDGRREAATASLVVVAKLCRAAVRGCQPWQAPAPMNPTAVQQP